MSYLEEFKKKISLNNYHEFLKLWEEYCYSDKVDPQEFTLLLDLMKKSELAQNFGQHVDRALLLWQSLSEGPEKHQILKQIFDLQNSNTEELANLAYNYLKEKYPEDSFFNEKIRIIGLRNRENFQGALSGFELLTHLKVGNFVYHTAGWGTGEIIDLSLIREEMTLEFEYVIEQKHLTFQKSLKTLIPLSKDHFLALRFGRPEVLEKIAKEDPVELISLLLKDLGPKSASEIKDELAELIIPENEWSKWWQNTRSKLKKSTKIETPEDSASVFVLRNEALTHEQKLVSALEKNPEIGQTIHLVYAFLRDFPQTLKNESFKTSLYLKLSEISENPEISPEHKLQVLFLLLQICEEEKFEKQLAEILKRETKPLDLLEKLEIAHFKKTLLEKLKKYNPEWPKLFLEELFLTKSHFIRDHVFDELRGEKDQENLKRKLRELILDPLKNPAAFIWYFQKTQKEEELFLFDKLLKQRFFENLLALLSSLSLKPENKDLAKKIISLLTHEHFKLVRDFMKQASEAEVKEVILISTKCQNLSDHELSIIQSLGQTAYPSLKNEKAEKTDEPTVIWTTREGYETVQNRLKKLASVETIQNAKEIEEARSHGDLRENAEYKAALERRDRLQSEIKQLSDQLKLARILTKEDIIPGQAGVGTVVECETKNQEKVLFTILGPWEANPEKQIFSFQSKLAQKMAGLKEGDTFNLQNEEYRIRKISSYLT
ncbi:MAG: GreA/GreB family elongation factor [Parachlamydiales bacterium]|jgi:transcription elongation factor GreA-like protein/transcription elongation GreA/GreB family factor